MSSSEWAVRARGVGKKYTIAHNAQREDTLYAALGNRLRNPFRRTQKEQFWALRDVSFDIKKGEVVGFIGRNGAGKSTLLKVLSRITDPTTGQIDLYGRVGSLLEVGTGFHPELTGRENIYLNGGILGMSRREVSRHFDEIVDFAGTEKFLDTPVKRYSSGMFVRLAFAVAAHLNPEILIIDEVLSVGDAEFQKKCLGKMHDVAQSGRTVLFVSHNTHAVLNLCSRAVLLADGQVVLDGGVREVVHRYLAEERTTDTFDASAAARHGDRRAIFAHFEVRPSPPQTGAPVEFVFDVEVNSHTADPILATVGIGILAEDGNKIAEVYSHNMGAEFRFEPGRTRVVALMDAFPFVPGRYRLNLWLGSGFTAFDFIEDCYLLTVLPGHFTEDVLVENFGFPISLPTSWSEAAEPSLSNR